VNVEVIVRPPVELAEWFVSDLEREVRAALVARPARRFTLAVPGGSVAEVFFPALRTAPIDWRGVDVFWVDERAVPPDSPESNYGLANRLWLAPAGVPTARVHRMAAEPGELASAAAAYAAELAAAAGAPPVLDYVLLGVGEDGHVASVFGRGTAGWDVDGGSAEAEPVAWTERSPKPPARRMTLSLATLARARRVVVAGFGERKARLLEAVVRGESGAELPVRRVLEETGRAVVLMEGVGGRG
jgi:6-phosphogluconolactonase